MKYEHQIDRSNVYDVNLDAVSSGLARNGSIYLLSTVQSLLSERMANSKRVHRTNILKKSSSIYLYDISRVLCLVAFRLFQAYFCCYCFYNRYTSLVSSFLLPSSNVLSF